jgi:putative peptide zinc metalloprotease protein
VGHIESDDAPRVRVVVPQWQLQPGQRIEVRLPQAPAQTWDATLARSVPAAARDLPSPALGTAAGGEIALDPHDPKGQQALQTLFEHELQLGADMPYRQIGTRVQVRFTHNAGPLAQRLWHTLRRLFLSHFQL